MTPEPTTHEDHRSSAEIEADIRRTRGRMDATLDELGERLTARSLLNTALDWWERPSSGNRGSLAAKRAAGSIGHTIKEHPMPALLIGAGLAMLMMDSSDEEDDDYESEVIARYRARPRTAGAAWAEADVTTEGLDFGDSEDSGPSLGEKAHDKMAAAKDRLSGAKDRLSGTGDRISEWGHDRSERVGRRARRTLQRSRSATQRFARGVEEGYHTGVDRFEEAVEDYPLAVGIGFAALGALAGVLLPRTRREDEMMGEQADHLMEAAKEKGEELLERGKVVGERVAGAAMEEAREQGLTAEAAKEKLSGVASKIGEVAHRAKEEAGTAAREEHLTKESLKQEAIGSAKPAGEQSPTGNPPAF